MPHAALWVVQLEIRSKCNRQRGGFNAARGFVGGATAKEVFYGINRYNVSMPHAALWVVQPHRSQPLSPYGEKALLESLRKFERSDGKYVKYLFLFSFSLRRNPLRDQHLARP